MKKEVGPIERVAGKFEAAGETVEVESVVEVETVVEVPCKKEAPTHNISVKEISRSVPFCSD